jgi:hypothetical protein
VEFLKTLSVVALWEQSPEFVWLVKDLGNLKDSMKEKYMHILGLALSVTIAQPSMLPKVQPVLAQPSSPISEMSTLKTSAEPLFRVVHQGQYGYINRTGTLVIPFQFDLSWNFVGARAQIKQDDVYGYIDPSGKIAIRPQFRLAFSFSEERAVVVVGTEYGYIDPTGKPVIIPQFQEAQGFKQGLAAVKVADKYGYIDKTGKLIIPAQFDFALGFSEGLAAVWVGDRYGYIDPTGKFVIPPQLEGSWLTGNLSFTGGLAGIQKKLAEGSKPATSSPDSLNLSTDPKLADANPNSDTDPASTEKWGYIDKTGKIVIEPQFDDIREFNEGLAAVQLGEQWGYINTKGTVVIPPQFERSDRFSQGLAAVKVNDQYGYIDSTGKLTIPPQFALGFTFNQGLALVYRDGKALYIDQTGKVVWQQAE